MTTSGTRFDTQIGLVKILPKTYTFKYEWTLQDLPGVQGTQPQQSPSFKISESITGFLELNRVFVTQIMDGDNYQDVLYCDQHIHKMSIHLMGNTEPLTVSAEIKVNHRGRTFTLFQTHGQTYDSADISIPIVCEYFRMKTGKRPQDKIVKLYLTITFEKYLTSRKNLPDSLTTQFESLLTSGKFADVTITVGSKKFHVHKLILMTRSSVFQAMFTHELNEEVTKNIDVTDIAEEVMQQLLKYLYTGYIGKIDDMVIELLYAAEKYDLLSLKSLCLRQLTHNLNLGNAAGRLLIADRYNATEEKHRILKFFADNRAAIMLTDDYKDAENSNPDLIHKAMKSI